MAPKPFDKRRADDVIRDADNACRESERVRGYVEESMKRRPFWPPERSAHFDQSQGNGGNSEAME